MSVNVSPTATEQLTPKQEQLIALMLAGVHINAAVTQIAVAERTAFRWLKLAHFQSAYQAAQKMLFNEALTGLMNKVTKAIDTLDRNMNADITTPAAVQVRAAAIILEQAISVHKLSELEQKLVELERLLKEQSGRR